MTYKDTIVDTGKGLHYVEHNGSTFHYITAPSITFSKRTHNIISPVEYVNRIENILPNDYKVLGFAIKDSTEYKGNVTKVLLYNGTYFQNNSDPNKILRSNKVSVPFYNEYMFICLRSPEQHDIELVSHKHNHTVLKHTTCGHIWTNNDIYKFFKNNSHCPKCKHKLKDSLQETFKNKFVINASTFHNSIYDYSNSEYLDVKTPVLINCTWHGGFMMAPKTHMSANGDCYKCRKVTYNAIKTTLFKSKGTEIHKGEYSYDLSLYKGSNKKILIKCSTHGYFEQIPLRHLDGKLCPSCAHGGFNSTKEGYFYIHKIEKDTEVHYKFGITNNPKRRFSEQKLNVLKPKGYRMFYSDTGTVVLDLENIIKNSDIVRGTLTKEEYSSGYTETVHEKDIDLLLKMVYDFMLENNLIEVKTEC